VAQFRFLLSFENWEAVFVKTTVNVVFNNFFEQETNLNLLVTGPFHFFQFFPKSLKKIIDERLYSHINKHNILVMEQFGITEKTCTEMATDILLNNMLFSLDKKLC
jgi:hypothetical protein